MRLTMSQSYEITPHATISCRIRPANFADMTTPNEPPPSSDGQIRRIYRSNKPNNRVAEYIG